MTRKNWMGTSGLALAVTVACGIPACDSSKPEEVATTTGAATTGLVAGDIVVTCFNTSGTDFFQIVPLVPIDNDTDLKFTDREATAAGQFNTGESVNVSIPLKTADAGVSTIPAG